MMQILRQNTSFTNLSKALLPFVIAISFFVLIFPLSIPVEGGIFFLVLGISLLVFQIWKFSTFSISKVFFLFLLQVVYLLVFMLYSKPIPATLFQIQRILILILLALLSYTTLRSDEDRKLWENALIIFILVLAFVSIYELFGWYSQYLVVSRQSIAQVAYRLSGSFLGHPNPLAGYINFVWPIVLIRLYNTPKKNHKALWGAYLIILLVVMFFTSSRGGWLGTFAGMAVVFSAILLRKIFTSNKRIGLLNLFQQYFKFILAGGLAFVVLLAIIFYRSMLTGSQALGFSSRSGIWIPVVKAIKENPISGHGIGTFPIAYTASDQLPPGFLAPSAHNLWLQVWVGYGLIGVIFICIVMILIVWQVVKTIKPQLINQIYFPIAYIASGTAFLVQQFFDYMLVTFSYTLSFVIILVLIIRYCTSFGNWKLHRGGFGVVVGSILVLLAVFQFAISSQISGFKEHNEARILAENHHWDALQTNICQTADEKEGNALYQFECSVAIAHNISLAIHNNETIHNDLLSSAISYQKSGQEFNPYWAIQEANLAVLYWENNQKNEALYHMRNAVNAAPKSHLLLINLGWMEEQLGNKTNAMDYYTRILRLSPLIRGSLFAQQSNIFQAAADLDNWMESDDLWRDWYAEYDVVPVSVEGVKGSIALFGNQPEIATQQFELLHKKSPGSLYRNAYLAFAYQRNGQLESAFDLAQVSYLIYKQAENITVSSLPVAIIGSIMLDNGDLDLAYELLSDAFLKEKNQTVYDFYYSYIYGQPMIVTDISPLLIRSGGILAETYTDWVWLVDEANRRGDQELSESIEIWLAGLQGIAH